MEHCNCKLYRDTFVSLPWPWKVDHKYLYTSVARYILVTQLVTSFRLRPGLRFQGGLLPQNTSLDSALMQPSCSIRASTHHVSLRYTCLFLLQPESVCSFGHESTFSNRYRHSITIRWLRPSRSNRGRCRYRFHPEETSGWNRSRRFLVVCSVPEWLRAEMAQPRAV